MSNENLFEKLSHPAASLPTSGGGFTIGIWTGSNVLVALSIGLVLVQLYVHSPKIVATTKYWWQAWQDWRAGR